MATLTSAHGGDSMLVGTCSQIEKHYLRLHLNADTQADPSKVRPESVLKQSLAAVQVREKNGEPYDVCKDYYMSICQDLRIQGVRSPFAVEVRESMALCALRARLPREKVRAQTHFDSGIMDVQAFSDCILHLSYLYKVNSCQPREVEFQVYRFLFWAAISQEHPDNTVHMNAAMFCLNQYKHQKIVKHAFNIYAAASIGDFRTYFESLDSIPADTKEQIHIHESLLVDTMREYAYSCLLKAFKFKIPCSAIQRMMGFKDEAALTKYLCGKNATIVKENEISLLDIDKTKSKSG